MADQFKRVAYRCDWCGLDFHDLTGRRAPRAIYNDSDGRQYCSIYCTRRGYAYYNGLAWPEPIPEEAVS